MTAFCGRTICNILTPDGTEKIALFNSSIEETSNVHYFSQDGSIKYQMPLTSNERQSGYRALHYARYKNNTQLESIRRIVPFYDLSLQIESQDPERQFSTVSPLYEVIGPSLLDIDGSKNDSLMFWTNSSSSDVPVDSLGKYVYKSENVLHFDENNLEEADLDSTSTRMLCSALLGWDILRTSGSIALDLSEKWTPIVLSVSILSVSNDGLAVDFSCGGSSSGIGRHNHSNNSQGGFAYAIFAPGTSLNPINWK